MPQTAAWLGRTELSRLKLFLALSRTSHGVLDLAAPAVAGLLAAGGFPPPRVVALGLATAFAGYTAVYALNDVVDREVDRERLSLACGRPAGDLDQVFVRHPLAQGSLSLPEGLLWVAIWSLLALGGAWLLNPACAAIFLAAALLEVAYCRLLRVHPLRALVSGAVKSSGALAAAFAVNPTPPPAFLAALFGWLFVWEIGGQNVPNDWADAEEDRRLGARTIPVSLGPERALVILVATLALAAAGGPLVLALSPARLGAGPQAAALAAGLLLLGGPTWRLLQGRSAALAGELFNRASFYPLAILAVAAFGVLTGGAAAR